jgi:NAD(P)-dependent dehydrogenase (short-subunit alcohol dehydrogenase family)
VNILVTGATDGIGRQTVLDLAKPGVHIAVHGRNAKRIGDVRRSLEKKGAGTSGVVADLASLSDVRAMAKEIATAHPELDVLVNNAGVFMNERVVTKDGFETTFEVNHLAPFLLTHLLLPQLEASGAGRVVNVSSMAHSGVRVDWDNLQGEKHFDGYNAYALSKLANVLFTIELARRLGPRPITVNALHPGVVSTKLLREGFGSRGPDSHEEGAATSVFLATSTSVAGKTGGYYSRSRLTAPSNAAQDPATQKRLYELSARMADVSPLPG